MKRWFQLAVSQRSTVASPVVAERRTLKNARGDRSFATVVLRML
jgi:hypothetical protein